MNHDTLWEMQEAERDPSVLADQLHSMNVTDTGDDYEDEIERQEAMVDLAANRVPLRGRTRYMDYNEWHRRSRKYANRRRDKNRT